MSNSHDFKFEVDINVINHLGVGLYSSTPAALTELVANAWDADATEVEITIDPDSGNIVIQDDGHGMAAEDIRAKFLKVGYSRRVSSTNKNKSESGNRRVMGRKGIGKLSMFALCNYVKVSSQAAGSADVVGFVVDVPELKKSIEAREPMVLEEFSPAPFPARQGTRIELQKVLKGLKTTESHLRVKLARRFSVLGSEHGFKVVLNKREITLADRDFYDKVQFLWVFDGATKARIQKLTPNLVSLSKGEGETPEPCIKMLDSSVVLPPTNIHQEAPGQAPVAKVTGYVASVQKPQNLGSRTDSANMLSIFANGRVFAENILNEANSAKYYQNYLVGEIHADFLDDDDVDRATASREAIKRDDPKYQTLLGFAISTLESIGDQWDEWRLQLGLDPDVKGNAAVGEWLATLNDKRDQALGKRLMTSIQNATIHSDETKNAQSKALLFRGAIIGFEKLKLRKELDKLTNITDVLSAEFAAVFAALSEVEEAAYAEITKQRLEIIRKFKEIANNPVALEKVAQEYLFDHLWLLDPSWDPVTGRAEMEKTLTEYIKRVNPDSTGARLDISYRASSGRHVVVELKKPSKTSLSFDDLAKQARKYRQAVEQFYRDKLPDQHEPGLDIYLLVSKTPTGMDERDRRGLAEQNATIITYENLIVNANNSYQEYLNATRNTGKLEDILARI